MNDVVAVYKSEGLTPLEALTLLREHYPQYRDSVLSYAGRLDPMAEGVMLVLVDEGNKNREKYLSLDKTYIVDLLVGIRTDTGDVLGLVTDVTSPDVTAEDVERLVAALSGTYEQVAPKYSSPSIDGKQFVKQVTIYSSKMLGAYTLSASELLTSIEERVSRITGEFRQKEIGEKWREILTNKQEIYSIFSFEVSCSSGTYMRSIAERLGEALGSAGLAYRIKRTAVGEYTETVALPLTS